MVGHRHLESLPGEVRVQAFAESLRSCDEVLDQLCFHLAQAQQRMVSKANQHRLDVVLQAGDLVYLKFRPYRQSSLFQGPNRKLAPRFFGPFEVEARVGAVAYRLKLPQAS